MSGSKVFASLYRTQRHLWQTTISVHTGSATCLGSPTGFGRKINAEWIHQLQMSMQIQRLTSPSSGSGLRTTCRPHQYGTRLLENVAWPYWITRWNILITKVRLSAPPLCWEWTPDRCFAGKAFEVLSLKNSCNASIIFLFPWWRFQPLANSMHTNQFFFLLAVIHHFAPDIIIRKLACKIDSI